MRLCREWQAKLRQYKQKLSRITAIFDKITSLGQFCIFLRDKFAMPAF
jgi:hypothetical protein